MSTDVEVVYDGFLSELGRLLGKIDVDLAVKVMYLERRFSDVSPSVTLDIDYKDGTNLVRKQFELSSKYGLLSSRMSRNVIIVRGNLSLKQIQHLATDSDVEKITGSATCASY